jgi:pimeloyl-ACP methyl ester carboxylesterase
MTSTESTPYAPRHTARSSIASLRGLKSHVLQWGPAESAGPPLVLLHGWMDVAMSFQFLVDALAGAEGGLQRRVIALDWRGFGGSQPPQPTDSYWFPDYLGDLDALLDAVAPGQAVDLLGHSMGGNVVMMYAGVRPERIRRLVNLEGFGLPRTIPETAPKRMAQWLDELKTPQALRSYTSLDAVADRLRQNNPRLSAAFAAFLAPHWAERRADGRWHILGDPAHKRVNPTLYRVEEHLAAWQRIAAPVLWVEGADTDMTKWWGDRYPRSEFLERLAVVRDVTRAMLADCGHMLHHDQPTVLAQHLAAFLQRP